MVSETTERLRTVEDSRKSWRMLGKVASLTAALITTVLAFVYFLEDSDDLYHGDYQSQIDLFETKLEFYISSARSKGVSPQGSYDDSSFDRLIMRQQPELLYENRELESVVNRLRSKENRLRARSRINEAVFLNSSGSVYPIAPTAPGPAQAPGVSSLVPEGDQLLPPINYGPQSSASQAPRQTVTANNLPGAPWVIKNLGLAIFLAVFLSVLCGIAAFLIAWAFVFVAAFAWWFTMQRLADIARSVRGIR